jgi:hypothetical protein
MTTTATVINKTVRLGTRPTYNGRRMNVFCKIGFDGQRLSISGVEGPTRNGNCIGACGQIDMHLGQGEDITPAPGWTAETIAAFLQAWNRWHLNDMRAGCEHQRALGWTKYEDHPSEPCPTCGYKYGSRWLTEEVPADVLAFLSSLPDTDLVPAWV